jgi:long-chain acyl-CoA synthetase
MPETKPRRKVLSWRPCIASDWQFTIREESDATEDYLMNHSIACNLIATAQRHPDRTALRLGDRALSFRELDDITACFARVLRELGVGPEDSVGVMLPNVLEFAVAYYGALRAGAVIVPMNVMLKAREVEFYLRDSRAKALICWHDCAAETDDAVADLSVARLVAEPEMLSEMLAVTAPVTGAEHREADDTAVILYTSGTTGRPKGAQLTHANVGTNAGVVCDLLGADEHDVLLGALPLFHAFGQICALNVTVRLGAMLTLLARFDPELVLETIERDQVTVFQGVPTMYSKLLQHPARESVDVSSLRLCISGGAALPVEVLHEFERAFGCVVLEGYGLSEATAVAAFNHRDRPRRPGSIGTPVAGVEMRIVDENRAPVGPDAVGEIAIRGNNVMKGYLGQPEATAEVIDDQGWLYTGDIGQVDEEGRYYIVDRKKDLIIRGGYNVYPREIEEVLYEHPDVREAAVIGIPDIDLGQEVGAAVSLNPGAETTESELRDYVKATVAAYKYPRRVWFLDELPKGPTGKILKREIVAPAEEPSRVGSS